MANWIGKVAGMNCMQLQTCWNTVLIFFLMTSSTSGSKSMEETMSESISDVLYDPPDRHARFFLNYDRAAAFNTSVAFTIPLFSFTLPGAAESSAAGLDLQSLGTLAFVALFLVGGLGVALYTTTQHAGMRSYEDESSLLAFFMDTLEFLPTVVDSHSCVQQTVCRAHADPDKYGLLAMPVRFLVSPRPEISDNELTSYQQAARHGYKADEDCHYLYPCLLQPLDLLMFMYDSLYY